MVKIEGISGENGKDVRDLVNRTFNLAVEMFGRDYVGRIGEVVTICYDLGSPTRVSSITVHNKTIHVYTPERSDDTTGFIERYGCEILEKPDEVVLNRHYDEKSQKSKL